MGKRSRRRAKEDSPPAASTTDYPDAEGNVLTLRDELSAGTLRKLSDLDARPAQRLRGAGYRAEGGHRMQSLEALEVQHFTDSTQYPQLQIACA